MDKVEPIHQEIEDQKEKLISRISLWVSIILTYYILSTLLPIDKLISKLYPIFGIAMLLMALGLLTALFVGNYQIPELIPENLINMTVNP